MNPKIVTNVAFLGSAGVGSNTPEFTKAYKLGELFAPFASAILTGGCYGLPYAAMLGAKAAGAYTIGVSPAGTREEHVEQYGYHLESDTVIYTGMGKKGRNVILVRSAQIAVFLAGGIGTLNEFTIAYDELNEKSVIAVLTNMGGFSNLYSEIALQVVHKSKAKLVIADSPENLHQNVCHEYALLNAVQQKPNV